MKRVVQKTALIFVHFFPLRVFLAVYRSLLGILLIRINGTIPHFKQREDTPFSFYHFILGHIDKRRPVQVLDIGSHDCYLAYKLAQQIHPESSFDCYDVRRTAPLYQNPNIHFHEMDFISLIRQENAKTYDYVILGAVLSLFQEEERAVLLKYLNRSQYLFIREVPRYGNMIDAYLDCFEGPDLSWNNFSENRLKTILSDFEFEILSMEHEYDIYIYAKPRTGTVE